MNQVDRVNEEVMAHEVNQAQLELLDKEDKMVSLVSKVLLASKAKGGNVEMTVPQEGKVSVVNQDQQDHKVKEVPLVPMENQVLKDQLDNQVAKENEDQVVEMDLQGSVVNQGPKERQELLDQQVPLVEMENEVHQVNVEHQDLMDLQVREEVQVHKENEAVMADLAPKDNVENQDDKASEEKQDLQVLMELEVNQGVKVNVEKQGNQANVDPKVNKGQQEPQACLVRLEDLVSEGHQGRMVHQELEENQGVMDHKVFLS